MAKVTVKDGTPVGTKVQEIQSARTNGKPRPVTRKRVVDPGCYDNWSAALADAKRNGIPGAVRFWTEKLDGCRVAGTK